MVQKKINIREEHLSDSFTGLCRLHVDNVRRVSRHTCRLASHRTCWSPLVARPDVRCGLFVVPLTRYLYDTTSIHGVCVRRTEFYVGVVPSRLHLHS